MRFSYPDFLSSPDERERERADQTHVTPLGAITSPIWISALFVLVLNDHVLKGLYAGVLTGKLSDLAGLFIAPALLAVLLGLKTRRGLVAGSIAIGAVFSAINLSPSLASAWDGAMSALLLPFYTTVDPTDLLALPALVSGTWHASRFMHQKSRERASMRLPSLALAGIATVACAASGGPTNPQRTPTYFTGTVTILNKTNEMHQIEIYSLDPGVVLDCDEVANNPDAILTNELFEGNFPQVVPLFSGEELAIDPSEWSASWNRWDDPSANQLNDCRAFLIRSRVLPETLVFWRPQDFFSRSYLHNADAPQELDPQTPTVVIDADYSGVEDKEQLHGWREITCPLPSDTWETEFEWSMCNDLSEEELTEAARVPEGSRYSLRSVNDNVPLHFERPRFESGGALQIPARCRTPGPGEGLDWERQTLFPAVTLDRIERGVDGCHTLHITPPSEVADTTLVCGPWEAVSRLQPPEDAIVKLDIWSSNSELELRVTQGADALGFGKMEFRKGPAETVLRNYAYEMEVRIGCDPILESCGEVSLPIDLRLESTDGNILIGPGESVDLGPIRGEIFLARANYRPLANTQCEEANESDTGQGVYAEIIAIIR